MGLHLENEVARRVVRTPTIIVITLYKIQIFSDTSISVLIAARK